MRICWSEFCSDLEAADVGISLSSLPQLSAITAPSRHELWEQDDSFKVPVRCS